MADSYKLTTVIAFLSLIPESIALCALVVAISSVAAADPSSERSGPAINPAALSVTDFFPQNFLKDGSVSYQTAIQQALDAAKKSHRAVVFPPIIYRLDDVGGVKLSSNQRLYMHGAKFIFGDDCKADGQAFYGEAVHDVRIFGGEIVGQNDVWPDGINIGGVRLVGPCQRIWIRDMHIRDLSSNGIGIFATQDQPARDVWLTDTIIQNCSNKYGDYTAPSGELRGPEKGSTRQDQGLVAFYFVHDFVVRGCRFENSRSDGTHFFRCRCGQFVENKVYRAKMGGYFIESSDHIAAANNIIIENGSRGATIERESRFCTLTGNTIEGSGREGLWIPDCRQCIVTGNVFVRNGRKPNTPRQIWNANITINEASTNDRSNQWAPGPKHYLIANNTIETDAAQVAAVHITGSPELKQILVKDNLLLGDNRRILVDGEPRTEIRVVGNGDEP